MQITGIQATKGGYKVKSIFINESKTVLMGSIQDLQTPDVFTSTKWTIDRKNNVAISQKTDLTDEQKADGVFDLSLMNVSVGTENIQPVKRNFYSFHKDAWHCKLYKWVFGKDAWKAHKTMCPYWWTMVVVILFIWLICIFKIFGKGSSEVMESIRSYQHRKYLARMDAKAEIERKKNEAERIRKTTFLNYITENIDTMPPMEAYEIRHGKDWSDYRYYLDRVIERKFDILVSKGYEEIRAKERLVELEHEELERKKRAEQRLKDAKREEKMATFTEFKENTITKVIGMLLVITMVGAFLYGMGKTAMAINDYIPWAFIFKAILWIMGAAVAGYVVYLIVKFIISPIIKFISKWISRGWKASGRFIDNNVPTVNVNVKLPKWGIRKKLARLIDITFDFLFGWIVPVGRFMGRCFMMIINFFIMSKDLIYAIYKKNCPTITWLEDDNNNNPN